MGPYKNKCCVPDCNDRSSKRHRFPKDETVLKTWIININASRLKDLTPDELYHSYYVCNRHFRSEYLVVGTRRGLRKDAVPTLYLPEVERDNRIEEHGESENFTPRFTPPMFHETMNIDESDQLTSVSMTPISLPGPSGIGQMSKPGTSSESRGVQSNPAKRRRGILQSVDVTREAHLTPKCKKLYKMLCEWGQKKTKLNSKFKNLKTRLANAEKVANSCNFTQLMERVNEPTYTFIMQQVKNQNLKPKARKFTLDEKVLSLSIFKASGKAYRLLSKIFCLPSRKTLTNLLNHIPLRPGINNHIVDSLKVTVSKLKDPKDKICAIVFDEMALSSLLSYNRKLDCVDGLEDDGKHRTPKIVNHVNIFMIKGIHRQWKQPFCFTFSGGPTKSVKLKEMIKEVISACQNIGLDVVATVCDQGGPNVAAINQLLKETSAECLRTGVENKYFGFLVNSVEIIPLYDVPHLFKGIRNNLLTKDLHFEENGCKKIAKWKHIEQFYMLDTMDDTTLCTKLSDAHIFPHKMNKMKVSLMAQVFSHQVGSLIKRISQWDISSEYKLEKEASDTGEFILFIDELFDSLNGGTKVAPKSKVLKGGVTETSGHEQFWMNSIQKLEKMKFWNANKQKFVTTPSIQNLIKTIRGFIYLKCLFKKMKYIVPRALNQDCAENFFGCIRAHGVRNVAPDVNHFITSFKSLLLNNFMSSHSPGSNCEDDFSVGALDNLRCFLTGEYIAGVLPLDWENAERTVPTIVVNARKTRIAKSTIAYIAGFVARKVLKTTRQCELCKTVLLHSDGDVDLGVIQARQYNAQCNLINPGSFLYFVTKQSLSRLFYLIPTNCHKDNLFSLLFDIISKDINFNVLSCTKHTSISTLIPTIIIRCILYYWCKSVNKVLLGKDETFVRLLQNKNTVFIDPIKLQARNEYIKKLKKVKRN